MVQSENLVINPKPGHTLNRYEFAVEDGDVIMLATDGVFDNVPDSLLLSEITEKVSAGCICVAYSCSRSRHTRQE